MPKRGMSDKSPGDDRQPFSDVGGPDARHAQTHDVAREAHTNPTGPERGNEDFAADIAPQGATAECAGHTTESRAGVDDKQLHSRLDEFSNDELAQVRILDPGTQLHQGSVYLDLNDLASGPFQAIGGQTAGDNDRYIAKRDTDYALWNRLTGDDREAEVERSATVER